MYEKTVVQIFEHHAVYVLDFFDGERVVLDCSHENWKLYMPVASDHTLKSGENDVLHIISLMKEKKTNLLLYTN